jgi:carboxyl-terminal processing protease
VENINNAYVGVGITISAQYDEDGNLLGYGVSDVTQGGPAEEAGVLSGDLLVQVDGTAVQDITLTETKNMVKGEEGTTVDLTFLRDGETITLTVERRSLTLVPATGQLLDGSIGYIAIDNFDAGCAETVEGLVEDLQAQGATALVFDVRNNPGGLKRELTDLLDYLLPEGIVFHTVNYAGEEEIVMSDSSCVDLPMAVLVNGDSYSAAEYFACALQEYGVGTVVGEKTCGKGYYQVGLSLSDGSCINLSIGKYYTPNGESLIDVGVTPDIELELSDEDAVKLARNTLDPQDDPQLQAAIQSVMP